MCNVTESTQQSNAPQNQSTPEVVKPTWEEMVSNPLLALTSFQTGDTVCPTWPYSLWRTRTENTLAHLKKSMKPGLSERTLRKKQYDAVYLAGILELLEWLYAREAAIAANRPEFARTLEAYRKESRLNEQYIEVLEEKLNEARKQANTCLDLARQATDAGLHWRERAMEDGPASEDFLNPANLAMRLQRPHKSN